MVVALSDNFGRSTTDSWAGGTVAWVNTGGSAADFDVDGAKGTQIAATTNALRVSRADAGSTNCRIHARVSIDNGAVAGAGANARIWGRSADDNNYYEAQGFWTTGDAFQLGVFKRVAGSGTTLAGFTNIATSVTANQEFDIILEIDGENIRAKAWPTLGAEPSAWTHEVTDSGLTTGTGIALVNRRETGNTNTNLKFSWDALQVDVAGIEVAEQDVYPPRVLISVTGLFAGNSIELYRVVGGERTPVRAGSSESVDDPSFLRIDAELPFGVPVTYLAIVNGVDEFTAGPTTYTLPGGKVALSDAITGAAAEVVILAWPEKVYDRQSSLFRVGGRNVAVVGDLGMFTGDIELFVETESTRAALAVLLANATEGVVQIRQAGGYEGIDSYVAVLGVTERRWSPDGSDQRRTVILRTAETESWAPALEAAGFTLQDIADAYDGLTLNDLAGDFATLLLLAQGDFSA